MFLLKKIASPLFHPLPLALILWLLGLALLWRRRRWGQALLVLGPCLVFLAAFNFTGKPLLERLEYYYRPRPEAQELAGVKWVVVLGAGIWDDPRLSTTARLTQGSVCRLVEGIRIWRQIPGARLLVSGGRLFNQVSEAEGLAKLARELGVPDSCIVQEDGSRDTGDQARLVASLVGEDRIVLVTSAHHLPRAMLLFRRQGLYPVPAASDFMVRQGQTSNPARFYPSSVGIEIWETIIHEGLGLVWTNLTGGR